jgi:hypothetical protein
MRKSILACVALTAALVLALSAGAWADVAPAPGSQDIGQLATSEQSASSTATSTQTSPANQAISVNILSPQAGTGSVTQTNSSAATSSAGNTNGTTQTAQQAAGGTCCGGTQAIGQAAGSGQQATSSATSTQTNPSNQAISVNILSPGAGSGDVNQSNSSSATSSAGNTNGTTQTAQQAAGGTPLVRCSACAPSPCSTCHPAGPTVQGIGQLAQNYQGAESQGTSTQTGASNVAGGLGLLGFKPHDDHPVLPVTRGGDVNQSNSSSATSSAGNTNGTTQSAAQWAGGCCGAVQAIGQAAFNAQHATSAATSAQWCPSNLAFGQLGALMQSNASAARSAAGNTNGTSQYGTQA